MRGNHPLQFLVGELPHVVVADAMVLGRLAPAAEGFNAVLAVLHAATLMAATDPFRTMVGGANPREGEIRPPKTPPSDSAT